MNRLIFVVGLLVIFVVPQAWASTTQYPDPYRQTMWNNLTDTVHTVGQTPQQAKWTKTRLHNTRTRNRINSINRAKRQAWLQGQ